MTDAKQDLSRSPKGSAGKWTGTTGRFILVAFLALAVRVWVVYSETLPISGDEIAHGNYVGYIHDHWSLPDTAVANIYLPPAQEGFARMSYEYYQPPGYYVLAAVLGGGTPIGARWVSVLMFMIALVFVWAAARDMAIVLALSFIPAVIITTSIISNDVFLLMGSAIMFYACQKEQTWAYILGGLVLATSKFHGLPMLLVIGVYYLVKRNYRWGIIGLAFAVITGGIVFWRWGLQVENRDIQVFVPTVLNTARVLHETLVTGFLHAQYDRIPQEAMSLAIVGGAVLTYLAVNRFRRLPDINKYVVIAICLVWAGWCVFKLYPTGRYLFAAIPWLALTYQAAKGGPRHDGRPGKPGCGRKKHN